MSFNPLIPIITDSILKSQRQIKANFQAINNAFADNHVALTQDPSISGMHNALTMRPKLADPATSVIQVALYSKIVSTIPELFFRPSSSQTPIQLTYPSIKVDSSSVQYSFIAGPFIIHGGFVLNPTIGQVVTLAVGANLLSVDLSVKSSLSDTPKIAIVIPTSINTPANSFTITYPPLVLTTIVPTAPYVQYLAIGN